MVAKYSERRVRISECAYMIRLRAVVCGENGVCDDAEDCERREVGEATSAFSSGEATSFDTRRSRQTNLMSPVSSTFVSECQ